MSDDLLKTVSMVSAMFDLMDGHGSAESIEQRARFYKTISGIRFPDDWDDLDLGEKRKRLDKLDEIGLETLDH